MRRSSCNHVRWHGLAIKLAGAAALCLALSSPAATHSATPTSSVPDTGDIKLRAETGDAASEEAYAVRLEAGQYYAEAAKWYRRAADEGRSESQYRLGAMLLKGHPRMSPDRPALPAQPLAAIGLLTRAAQQGHDRAQLELGRCYWNGTGVSPNPVEAYRWLLLAAETNAAARAERDRVALTLTADEIQLAQDRAKAFRAGDRSDPRIRIVTQADLESAKATPDPTAQPISQTEDPGEQAGLTASTNVQETNAEAAVVVLRQPSKSQQKNGSNFAASWSKWFTKGNGKESLASFKRFVVPVFLTGVVLVLGLIGFIVVIGRVQRRKNGPHPIAQNAPPPAPPVARKRTVPPPPGELQYLRSIDWTQFEKLMEHLYTGEGYQVNRPGGSNAEGALDLELLRDGTRTAVQCRHWKQRQIGIKEVTSFVAAMTAEGFSRGVLVTISNYTAAALELARKNGVEILDGAHLVALLREHGAPVNPQLVAA